MENKPREIKQLLQTTLNNIDLMRNGLCFLVFILEHKKIINHEEELKLKKYLKKNRPLFTDKYWFPEFEKEPRIKWLQKHIKKQDSFWNKIKNLW